MRLNEQLLEGCEEFFDQITNDEGSKKLDHAVSSLREFLEDDVDGFTSMTEERLARAVQCRLMEIWGLISKLEKTTNPDLYEYYNEIVESLEDISGYQTDDVDESEDEP